MLRGNRATILMALVLVVALAGSAYAQAFGRVVIIVKDEEGNPVKDVEITVTTKEITNFLDQKSTNKKGRAVFSMTDGTRTYDFKLTAEGFPPMDFSVRPAINDTTTREITLSRAGNRGAGGGGGGEAGAAASSETTTVYTPAERVFNEGVEALRAGDIATAKANFLTAVERDPRMILAHSALAGVYLEEGDFNAALVATDQVLELEPDNPRATRFRYEAYKGLGDEENADKTLKQLQRLAPGGDTIKMIFNEGVAATKVGDLASAKARFLEVLELDANFKEAIGALGVIFIKEGDFDQAVAMAERMLAVDPTNLQAKKIRYDSYRALGDTEKAQAAMMELAADDPSSIINQFYNEGAKAFENGDTALARENFEQVLVFDENHAATLYQLGITLISSGETAQARTHLEKFLQVAPNHPEAATAQDMLQYLE